MSHIDLDQVRCNPIEIFISYSHYDKDLKDKLLKSLSPLHRTGSIEIWHDREIGAGGELDREIKEKINTSHIILLLISNHFFASNYCYNIEMKRAMERYDAREAIVIPIILSPCQWYEAPFGKLKALPRDGKAITDIDIWPNQDKAFFDIAENIQKEVKKLQKNQKDQPNKEDLTESNKSSSSLRVRRIPYRRNLNFIGRESYFDELRDILKSGHPAAIFGLGGMGKTQIAFEYAYRSANAGDYDVIWCIQSENIDVLQSQFSNLAEKLGLCVKSPDESYLAIETVKEWLESNDRWLLIFDNVQKPKDIYNLLPDFPKGHVIITSRHQKWGHLAKMIKIKEFPREESIKFIIDRTGKKEDDAADMLAHELGDLPLALEHSCAYIETNGITVSEYLKRFQNHQIKLFKEVEPSENYPLTLAKTWEISLNKVAEDSPASVNLLKLCAFLSPENIPKRLLINSNIILNDTSNEKDIVLDHAIGGLKTYSLIDVDDISISVHRLVQTVTRDSLTDEDKRKWSESAVNMVYKYFSFTYPRRLEMKPHVSASLNHAENLGLANDSITSLSNMIKGFLLFHNGDVNSAIQLFSIILNRDPLNSEVRFYRGLCYLQQGKRYAQSAILDLEKASEMIDDLDIHVALGKAYYLRSKIFLAEKEADKALEPEMPHRLFHEIDAKILKGKCLLKMEDYDGCINILDKVPANNFSVVNTKCRALIYRGRCAITHEAKLVEYTKAIELLDEGLKLAPTTTNYFIFRAIALSERGEPDDWNKALNDFSQAIKLSPKDSKPWENKGDALYRKAINSTNTDVERDELLMKALMCYKEALDRSARDYKSALRNKRALVFQLIGEFDEGLEEARKSVEENPKYVQNYMTWACAGIAAFNWKETIKAATSGLKIAEQLDSPASIWLLLFRIIGRSGDNFNKYYITQDYDRLFDNKKKYKEFKPEWDWNAAKKRAIYAMKDWPKEITSIIDKSIYLVEGDSHTNEIKANLGNLSKI